MEETYVVQRQEEARVLASPLTLQILAAFDEPKTAAEVARRLELPRNRVGYHVRKLAGVGLLQEVRRRGRRIYYERRAARVKIPYALMPFAAPDEAVSRYVEDFVKGLLERAVRYSLMAERPEEDFLVLGAADTRMPSPVTALLGEAAFSSRALDLLKELEAELRQPKQGAVQGREERVGEYLFAVIVVPSD